MVVIGKHVIHKETRTEYKVVNTRKAGEVWFCDLVPVGGDEGTTLVEMETNVSKKYHIEASLHYAEEIKEHSKATKNKQHRQDPASYFSAEGV